MMKEGEVGQASGAGVNPNLFESRFSCLVHTLLSKLFPGGWGWGMNTQTHPAKVCLGFNLGQSGPTPHPFEKYISISADAVEYLFAFSVGINPQPSLQLKEARETAGTGGLGGPNCHRQCTRIVLASGYVTCKQVSLVILCCHRKIRL